MSRTTRWWSKAKSHCKIIGVCWWNVWDNVNPYNYKHESKKRRVVQHRNNRRENKLRIKLGRDVEKELKTQGWETH